MTGIRSLNAGRRIALVGTGKQGLKLIEALESMGYEIVAGCDLNADSLKKFSAKHPNALATQTISEIGPTAPELVIVGTLAEGHLPVIQALDAIDVKKILCEKPVANSVADLRDLQELAQNRELKIAVNHGNLWNPEFQAVKELVQSKPFGNLQHAAAHFKPAGFGNMGSHNLACSLQILGAHVTSVRSAFFTGEKAKKRSAGHNDHNAKVTFLLDSGIELELNNLPTVAARNWRLVFEFEQGRIELYEAASCYVIWNGETGRITEVPFKLKGYGLKKAPIAAYTQLDRTVSSILEDELQDSFSLACEAVEGIIAAQHCYASGTPVSLPLERDTQTLNRFS